MSDDEDFFIEISVQEDDLKYFRTALGLLIFKEPGTYRLGRWKGPRNDINEGTSHWGRCVELYEGIIANPKEDFHDDKLRVMKQWYLAKVLFDGYETARCRFIKFQIGWRVESSKVQHADNKDEWGSMPPVPDEIRVEAMNDINAAWEAAKPINEELSADNYEVPAEYLDLLEKALDKIYARC